MIIIIIIIIIIICHVYKSTLQLQLLPKRYNCRVLLWAEKLRCACTGS